MRGIRESQLLDRRVAVALHEHSFVSNSLDRDFSYLAERFQSLEAVDGLGIARPTVLITEFGWEYQHVAPIDQAIDVQLPWADGLYAAYPEIKGAAIWYLGPGFGGVSKEAQRLIAPLTEYALQNYFVLIGEGGE